MDTAAHEPDGVTKRAFVWPPRTLDDAWTTTPAPETFSPNALTQAPPSPTRRIVTALAEIESFWLAPTSLPLSRRIERTGWRPDRPDNYCDRCGESIGPYETDEFGCANCRGRSLPWKRFLRLGEYDGFLGRWVIDAKFHRQRRLAGDLGRCLGSAARRAGLQAPRLAVVPVAMAWTRRFVRPYDQTKEIAMGVARELRAPLVEACHRKPRPSQRSVPTCRRRANVRGSFRPRWGVDFIGWTVLLVDDVCTTGSTLLEAASLLKQLGASEIWAAAVAVTPKGGRRKGQSRGDGLVEESSAEDGPSDSDNAVHPGVGEAPERPQLGEAIQAFSENVKFGNAAT